MSKPKTLKNHKKSQKIAKKDYFDQEEQNFDALQMQEHHDTEYETLLKSSTSKGNLKKNAYFFNDKKYGGANLQQDQQDDEVSEDDSGEQQNQIASAIKTFQQQRKKQSKLLTQDVRKIDEEDEDYEIMRKKQKTSDQSLDQAIGLKDQLNCQKMLIEYRYSQQNLLQSLKKFPKSNFPNNQNLHQLQKELELNILKNLSLLTKAYSTYSKCTFNTSQLSNYIEEYQQNDEEKADQKLNASYIHQNFTNESEQIAKNTEKQLVKWSQKTNLINISSSHYTSLLMQTPVGQAKKILSNWDRVKNKCQQKRGVFKILFQDQENVRQSTDPQIFDDFELFTELQKNFISSIEDDKDFRVSDTLRYLKNRQNREEKSKQVDRRASKNRKLRFNVQPKLLNFLPSYPQNTIEARDEIVQNFFNCKQTEMAPQKNRQDGETYYIDM